MGADFCINYKKDSVHEKVMEFTANKGADIIADPVGAQNADTNQKSAALDCTWVLFGFLGGFMCANFDMGPLLRKRIKLVATTLKSRSVTYKADLIAKVGQILFPAEGGQNFEAKPVIDRTFNMSEAKQAHQYMESNASIGKVLLKNDL